MRTVLIALALGCQPKPAGAPPTVEPASDPGAQQIAEERWNQTEPVQEVEEEPELEGPTEAQFRAWDRKDPEGQKQLYKYDADNFDVIHGYFHDLHCFRERAKEEGEKAFGAKPGTKKEDAWFKFKRAYVNEVDGWQKRLFANHPRIMEKSKFLGTLLEAHELVMYSILKAYNEADRKQVEKTDAHWTVIDAKFRKYAKRLGKTVTDATKAHCKALKLP